MTIKEIVEGWLDKNGYTGLISRDGECGCERSDLIPCQSEGIENCRPGYKTKCTKDCEHERMFGLGWPDEWHIQEEKPKL